jgi:hypothetical protein
MLAEGADAKNGGLVETFSLYLDRMADAVEIHK